MTKSGLALALVLSLFAQLGVIISGPTGPEQVAQTYRMDFEASTSTTCVDGVSSDTCTRNGSPVANCTASESSTCPIAGTKSGWASNGSVGYFTGNIGGNNADGFTFEALWHPVSFNTTTLELLTFAGDGWADVKCLQSPNRCFMTCTGSGSTGTLNIAVGTTYKLRIVVEEVDVDPNVTFTLDPFPSGTYGVGASGSLFCNALASATSVATWSTRNWTTAAQQTFDNICFVRSNTPLTTSQVCGSF